MESITFIVDIALLATAVVLPQVAAFLLLSVAAEQPRPQERLQPGEEEVTFHPGLGRLCTECQ